MNNFLLGQIFLVPYSFAPAGMAVCDGTLLPINGNQMLFSLIGPKFGGNGTTDFAVPDLTKAAPTGTMYVMVTQGTYPER